MPATAIVPQGSIVTLFARVKDKNTNEYPTHSSTSAITVTVYDVINATLIRTFNPSKTDVMSDAIVTNDDRFQEDYKGQNIRLTLSDDDTAVITDVRVTMTIIPVTGNAYPVEWTIQIEPNE